MGEYDDDRYLELLQQLGHIIGELLDMDGNTPDLIRSEVDNIIENVSEE